MAKPIVAIVGRPNVGKSTLFNRIAKERIAIVQGEPGVTRDRIYTDVEWLSRPFTLIDTGGIDVAADIITQQVREQAEIAIEQADVIIFVVDGRAGLLGGDEEVAQMLRRTEKQVILCVNKVEDYAMGLSMAAEFYALGLGEPLTISAEHGRGIGDLLDQVLSVLPEIEDVVDDDTIKIAIVGRPNVGKSSLVNQFAGKQRVIVTNIPGTTRDAIDTYFTYQEQNYLIIDTAGMRRKGRIDEHVERYSVIRALRAIDRCDVAFIMLDATEGLTEQDKKIAGYVHESGKGSIIVVNKWDLVDKDTNTMRDFEQDLRSNLQFLSYAPVSFISALTGRRIHQLLETADQVVEQRSLRISTGRLNEIIRDAVALNQPPSDKGVRLKIYYATQAQVNPPVFLIYVNKRDLMHFSYERYLENRLRREYGFVGTPVILSVKERQ